MPALVTCGKAWNVGTDDFALPAFFAVVIRLVCIGAVVGVLIYLFVGPEGCSDQGFDPAENVPPFLYGSLFAFIGIEFLTVIVENIILSISLKGPIYDHIKKNKRRWLPFWLLVRVILFFVETAVVIVCTVAILGPAPYAAGAFQCPEYHDGPLVFAEAVVVTLLVLLSLYAIGFAIYLDPLGICCAPSVLEDLGHIDEAKDELDADVREYLSNNQLGKLHRNHIGFGRVFRKVRGALCCLNAGGKRSRTTAMQEVSLALHTVFSDVGIKDKSDRIVPSDLVAGMILVSRNQKKKRENCSQCANNRAISCTCLTEEFRKLTLSHLPKGDKPSNYETKPPQKFDFTDSNEIQLFDDLVHYMHYAMGVYGWTLHVFDNLCCGLCQLCSVTCCVCNYRCVNKRHGTDFHFDDLCMSGVGTIKLRSHIQEREVIYATYENEVYQAPFSICLDNTKKSIVLSVRGTLSIKDALTDMSPSMVKLDDRISSVEGTQCIHKGMYLTATQILKELNKSKVLDNLIDEHKDYQLVITGHSLGAGVASVLAVLLKPKEKYRNLVCYAFSPPGCVLSFPLALYSRKFTTSVILGNDMVPRVSFRSLLYLKRQLLYLLKKCQKPKMQVIYQPRWVEKHIPRVVRECCCGPHVDPEFDVKEIIEDIRPRYESDGEELASKRKTSISAVTLAMKASRKWKSRLFSKDSLHHFVEGIESGEQIAAFPPGSMVHIKVTQVAKPLCLGYCYPNKLAVERISSEDLCVMIMDRGMMDDHLPNAVLNALKRCKKQFLPKGAQYGHQRTVVAEPLQEKNTVPSPAPPQVQVTIEIEETV